MRSLLVILMAGLLSSAAAQICTAELQLALPGAEASRGQVAASLMAQMVRLVEPALPARRDGAGPVEQAGPAADAVTYLHRRRLLPDDWSPEGHTPEDWATMLRRFAAAFQVEAPEATGLDTRAMLQEAGRTIERVGAAVRPLAVFAVGEDGAISMFAVIWNWTSYPRLLLFRPAEGLELSDGPSTDAAADVLAAMATCALRFDLYVYADEADAVGLFVAQGRSTVRVLGAEPAWPTGDAVFEGDEVVDVLTFRSPAMANVRVASVAIEGPSPGIGTVLALLTRVRTNVGPPGLVRVLALP